MAAFLLMDPCVMSRLAILFVATLTLGGCASTASYQLASPSSAVAWDGRDQWPDEPSSLPRKPAHHQTASASFPAPKTQTEEAELGGAAKYSDAWWKTHDKIEADADARLARKLVICRGCFRPNSPATAAANASGPVHQAAVQ